MGGVDAGRSHILPVGYEERVGGAVDAVPLPEAPAALAEANLSGAATGPPPFPLSPPPSPPPLQRLKYFGLVLAMVPPPAASRCKADCKAAFSKDFIPPHPHHIPQPLS